MCVLTTVSVLIKSSKEGSQNSPATGIQTLGNRKERIRCKHMKGCAPTNPQLPLLQIKCIQKERLKPIYAQCPGTKHLWHRWSQKQLRMWEVQKVTLPLPGDLHAFKTLDPLHLPKRRARSHWLLWKMAASCYQQKEESPCLTYVQDVIWTHLSGNNSRSTEHLSSQKKFFILLTNKNWVLSLLKISQKNTWRASHFG